ncbi:MAG: allantoinase AllB [Pseudonocardiaceae bacterium]|nr:allantoinase AllB [Pseudonocardiaceae bacterium]
MSIAIRSKRVVLPGEVRPATVRVVDGRIDAILPYDVPVPAIDCAADALLPGLVDTHVHVNEPGRTEWEGFATATRAAAAGGVTTLLDMPLNSLPPTVDADALEVKRRAAGGQCAVDVGFWGGAIPGNLAALEPLHDNGVYGFKCFLADSGVPEFPPLNAEQLDAVLAETGRLDALLIVHAEASDRVRQAGNSPHYRDFLGSRPAEAELDAITQLAAMAARHGARVHVLHLSAADALDTIKTAKRSGARISAETCPHYLVLDAADVPDGATAFKCCPPIRGGDNADALWAALADGTIDCVVSDHSPATPELKNTGCFGTAWGGIASLQLGLPLVWTEARRRGFALTDVVRWMAAAPAALAGLPGRGRIEAGAKADLVRFDPDATFTVDPAALAHRHPVSPYAGRELTGVVRQTWLAGRAVSGEPTGRLLSRGDTR